MYFIHFENDYFKNIERNSLDKSQKKRKTLFILLTFMFSESDDHPRKNVISIYSHTRFFKSSKINFIKNNLIKNSRILPQKAIDDSFGHTNDFLQSRS